MKPFLVFLRIIIVGILWAIVFTEGIRVIMLCNWHFDIFWPDHWRQAIALWKAGWVVRAPKEWAFIILLITFIPMLITGWWTLSMVAWEEIIYKIITSPVALYRYFTNSTLNQLPISNRYGIVKRKSYKQIRPAGVSGLHIPISDYGDNTQTSKSAAPSYSAPAYSASSATRPAEPKKTDVAATIDHALFKFDDDDDDDFDLDIDSFEKTDISQIKPKAQENKKTPKYDFDDEDETKRSRSAKYKGYNDDGEEDYQEKTTRNNRRNKRDEANSGREGKNNRQNSRDADRETRNKRRNSNEETNEKMPASPRNDAVAEALKQKNYDIIANVKVGTTVIDYVAVSENDICLCLTDKETGDWLADEEMFNGEDPLWFSESSHRVSPVCVLNNAWKKVQAILNDAGFEQKVSAYVIIQMANIINADDMFEIWNDMQINVTRINRGSPKEIRLFSKTLPDADGKLEDSQLDKLKRVLGNIH